MNTPAWQLRDRLLNPGRPPLVMGIVNLTPDSFSDGGQLPGPEAAVARALDLVRQGADLLDLGAESSRPGAEPVSLEEELKRLIPVVRALAPLTAVPLSIDTTKAEVARQALEAGASVINDVTALAGDPQMAEVVRSHGAGLILMHMQGTPQTMQVAPAYADVVAEVRDFLQDRLQIARDAGIAEAAVVLDPGIGFGKTVNHNLDLLANLSALLGLGRPLCLGVSRKGFLGHVLGRPLPERLAGSLAAACHALAGQAVGILRVHDVAPTCDAVTLFSTLEKHRAQRLSG